ncbi:GNAT family N-acetyltransferase [Conexibacter sp. SYSU D00693]|uniref:GNAT family N-acetyltransferase n=1 Tax=Conexibacter sp. SYSU D00693 TaxID=2812560 RepID=UPI00196AAE56|nr:GNAT family N-acetyltransferase [Conexibacter sp. SYSU D00693]
MSRRPQVVHTAELGTDVLDACRALLDEAFEGDFDDHDWEHSLGGIHALVWEGYELVAHAAVVQRRMLHRGRALRCGYVEGVGVAPEHQRRGHGGVVMTALERVIHGAYDLGALGATDPGMPFYRARGWQAWRGPLGSLTPRGIVPSADESGFVLVLPTDGAQLDLDGELVCDWRDGDVW